MKVLALSSSPRIGGNTDLLVTEILRAIRQEAAQAGPEGRFEITECRLSQMTIRPCTQCDHCHRQGTCNLADDMEGLYPQIEAADWLILASPIYFMAHCAQAKLLIDRCQVFWARRYILKQSLLRPGQAFRRGVFVSVGATHGVKVFAGVKVTMKWFFDALEMEYWDNLLFEGCDQKGRIRHLPTALQDARELGRRIVQASL
ncbi:MAG: flavodoxin family protein [Sedimentisphaerales bacterium]|nr:flavodoxin family protein [Sedimentisphaerales bacterium]